MILFSSEAAKVMKDIDNEKEIARLHDAIYEQSLVFLALRTGPGSEARLAETRERIIRICHRTSLYKNLLA